MLTIEKSALAADLLKEHRLLKERLVDARRRSDALFAIVLPSALYERPIPERHRIIFYIGHLEAFDWNLLNGTVFHEESIQPALDRLFAFGIDPVGGGLPTDVPSDWPPLDVVRDYVDRMRRAVDSNLERAFAERDELHSGFSLRTLLNVAVGHRLMHVETLAYMLHQLPFDMKVAEVEPLMLDAGPMRSAMVEIPGGSVTLGLHRGDAAFGWDNEYDAHIVDVATFEMDPHKVTNRQYLEFVSDGGYEKRELWKADDWNWKNARGIFHPLFWKKTGDGWLWRAMFEEVPLPPDWPVYVSHAEASAYAQWAGKSLPTEAEWQRAAYGTPEGSERSTPWGDTETDRGNFDFHRWNPTPVNAFPQGQSAFGVHDLLGNGWEWTSTVFGPFPGFEPFPFYRGYSADFFDGKHFVMKGGSSRTAACMLRPTFRNWFQAHYQYVYAAFRCVSRGQQT